MVRRLSHTGAGYGTSKTSTRVSIPPYRTLEQAPVMTNHISVAPANVVRLACRAKDVGSVAWTVGVACHPRVEFVRVYTRISYERP